MGKSELIQGLRAGIVGLPIEDLELDEDIPKLPAYVPGITDLTRKMVIAAVAKRGVRLVDLGEPVLGERYKPKLPVDRNSVFSIAEANGYRSLDMRLLLAARENILNTAVSQDLLVAIGPSHLGAIVLYADKEHVARMDYHSDFSGLPYEQLMINFASYMNWVQKNIKDPVVANYFVRYTAHVGVFGKLAEHPRDLDYRLATHFDIDVDCFESKYGIENVYPHTSGYGLATPSQVIGMVGEARPKKIGFWEYRPAGDAVGNGLEFMADAIAAAIGQEKIKK